MKIQKITITATIVLLSLPISVSATDAVNKLLAEYQSKGAGAFSEEAGKALWIQEFTDKKTSKIRQCTTCHTDDLRNGGKHVRTGKVIKPLALSVNPERLMDIKKIRKWLKRNCKWTIGRECSSQEKGDILTFIQAQ
jgi:ribosomal protein S17